MNASKSSVASSVADPKKSSLSDLRWRATRPMLGAAALIATGYLSLAALVIAVDPYNVYSWGAEPRLETGDSPRDLVVNWIDVVLKDPAYNAFLVGSSVTAMFEPDVLNEVLGPDSNAVNISYGGPRPRDRDLILNRLVKHTSVQHIILTFDWTYIRSPEVTNIGFPAFLYDDDITNDLRMVNLPTIRTTLDVLNGGLTYSNSDDAMYTRYVSKMYDKFQRPPEMDKIERVVQEYRDEIGDLSGKDCDSFEAIRDQLVPAVTALSNKGVKVDIMVPISSFAFYYVRRHDISPTLLDEMMISRRCMVEATSDLPNVRVFAFDGDPRIAGDLANFREVGHVYDPDVLKRFITAIATGKDRLTRENIAQHEADIRRFVQEYRPTNTRLFLNTEVYNY